MSYDLYKVGGAALLLCVGVVGCIVYATNSRPETIDTVGVFTTQPCEVVVDIDGKVLSRRHVTFAASGGAHPVQAVLSLDHDVVVLSDGLKNVIVRQPRWRAHTIAYDIEGQTAPISYGERLGFDNDSAAKLTVTVKSDDLTPPSLLPASAFRHVKPHTLHPQPK